RPVYGLATELVQAQPVPQMDQPQRVLVLVRVQPVPQMDQPQPVLVQALGPVHGLVSELVQVQPVPQMDQPQRVQALGPALVLEQVQPVWLVLQMDQQQAPGLVPGPARVQEQVQPV
ncbi:MAG: hypothetical protein L0211_16460, partial [Planctomycetaceae bacterium]|nr:hypothetical protein [Planctomycetaceae bacterium]